MTKIKSQNTKSETLVFRELRKRRIYFRRHYKGVLGNPDIAFPRKKIAVFIDGDFWHGYKFSKLKKRLPKKYWVKKIKNNITRDRKVDCELRKIGWHVVRIWEHDIKVDPKKATASIQRLLLK